MLITFLIIFLLREFFWLLPQQLIVLPNVIRISDIGILLMAGTTLFVVVANSAKIKFIKSSFTLIILSFILLSFLNVYFSNSYYQQPITEGLRAIRSNLYYLIFFVVIFTLDNKEKLMKFLRWLTVLCLLLVAVTFLQYAMPSASIFHVDNSAMFKQRFGFYRLINPGLDLVMLAYFITIARFIQSGVPCRLLCLMSGIIFTTQFFLSQTRGYLLSFPLAMMISMTVTGKFRWLVITVWCFAMGVGALQMTGLVTQQKHENFVTRLIESSITETLSRKGNVGIRYETAKAYWNYAMQHPITGTGIISPLSEIARKLKYPILRTDLGYVIMFSQYGLLGIAWLIWLSLTYFKKVAFVYRRIHDDELKAIVLGLMSHFIFMLISFITLPHFILATMIVTVAINIAILEIIHRLTVDAALQEEQLHASY
ncbi:O-antigen ligase family protein [Geotalea uraniireducens]|nr:O-antigen ligase family protein [Geotalea uraniireducens]